METNLFICGIVIKYYDFDINMYINIKKKKREENYFFFFFFFVRLFAYLM